MYTIKQASIRTGVGIPLLRAWERRYGIPTPERTASGYRLYDERSIDRVRRMRDLVDAGWSPSQAARSILEAPEPAAGRTTEPVVAADRSPASERALPPEDRADRDPRLAAFREAAARLDEAAMDGILGEAFAALGVEAALEAVLLPAVASLGDAWARGELDVAAEHAASSVAMRKLAALYDTAGASAVGEVDAVVGLPPGARHEVGALAFAVACRRRGLRVRYLGADVPLRSWLAVSRDQPDATLVLAAVTPEEARSAASVAAAVEAAGAPGRVAIGGRSASLAAGTSARPLTGGLRESVTALASIRGLPAG